MPFTVLLHLYRKPSISPSDFKSHIVSHHIRLIQSLTGIHFPISHKRLYLQRSSDASKDNDDDYPATVPMGTQSDFPYDALAELTFEDATHFHTYAGIKSQSDAREAIAQDEKLFCDGARTAMVVLGEIAVTEGTGKEDA